jgi:hypothetical protein
VKRRNVVMLQAWRDERTGEIGLVLKDMPKDETTNAATNGLLLAHDIVEHVNGPGAIGTIDDELEALGAIWYVRGQHGELRRDGVGFRYTIEENIAADVTRMFRDFFHGSPVNTRKVRTRPCDADDAFREIIGIALVDSPAEVDDYAPVTERAMKARLREYLAVCLPRMRIGYRKAVKRYERHGRYFANNLFWEIAGAVECYAKHADTEGVEYWLVYGIDSNGSAYAHCEEFYGEDFE